MDSYYKLHATAFLLQSATRFITSCDRYYKVRDILQIAMVAPPPPPHLKVWIQHCCKSGVNGVFNSETCIYRCVVVDWNERVSLCWNWFTLAPEMTSNGGEWMKIQVGRGGRRELSLELMLLCWIDDNSFVTSSSGLILKGTYLEAIVFQLKSSLHTCILLNICL